MNKETLRDLLGSLSWRVFSAYVRELFSLRHAASGEDGVSITTADLSRPIGDGTFEQCFRRRLETCGFHAVFVHPLPIELLTDPRTAQLLDPVLTKKIEKYRRRSQRREASWYFPSMGGLAMDQLSIVSNAHGLSEAVYMNKVLPEFENLLERMEYLAVAEIGSVDSFVDLAPEDAATAFDSLIRKHKGGLDISLSEERVEVSEAVPGKYITSGAVGPDLDVYEPVFAHGVRHDVDAVVEFEHLLNSNPSERQIEAFLVAHYKEVFGFKYDRVETQLWLHVPELDIGRRSRRLDVFLRNSVENDWDLFEVKRPVRLTRTSRDVPALAAHVVSAIQQLRNYAAILSQNRVRELLRARGIHYCEPSLHLVVGRDPEVSTEQWRWIKATNGSQVKLLTYTNLLDEMKARVRYYSQTLATKDD